MHEKESKFFRLQKLPVVFIIYQNKEHNFIWLNEYLSLHLRMCSGGKSERETLNLADYATLYTRENYKLITYKGHRNVVSKIEAGDVDTKIQKLYFTIFKH